MGTRQDASRGARRRGAAVGAARRRPSDQPVQRKPAGILDHFGQALVRSAPRGGRRVRRSPASHRRRRPSRLRSPASQANAAPPSAETCRSAALRSSSRDGNRRTRVETHEVRPEMPHHRRLDGAAVQSVSPFLVREPRVGGARTVEVAGLDDQQIVFFPQPARRDVDGRQVAAVAVGDDQAPHAGGRDGGAGLDQGLDQQFGGQAERAREAAVLAAGADRLRRQRPGREVRGSRRNASASSPRPSARSVESGRCGPCCSIAAVGNTITGSLAARAAASTAVRVSQWRIGSSGIELGQPGFVAGVHVKQ